MCGQCCHTSCDPRGKQKRGRSVRSQPRSLAGTELAHRLKSILETRNLSVYSVSQQSQSIFGHSSPYFLPHNLYYELKIGTFSPSLHQVFALSRISNYKMTDWLHVFGLDLEEIMRQQILLPTKRTILLDASLSDPNRWVQWFRERSTDNAMPTVAPLSKLLKIGPAVRQVGLLEMNRRRFLYAKIGREDALAFPDLLPGSIVRVNPCPDREPAGTNQLLPNRIFLVEHAKGICCGRLLSGKRNRIVLVSSHLPYAQVEFQLQHEANILGMVDLEVRQVARPQQPEIPRELARRWKPEPLARGTPTFSQFIRAARTKAGLSLREASHLSERIAAMLGDERYFMSASSLSDYEADDTFPGRFQKAASLSLLYAIPFRGLLEVAGIPYGQAGTDPIPDGFIPRSRPAQSEIASVAIEEPTGFLGELLRQMEDVPVVLKGALPSLSGLRSPSLRSVFWVGGLNPSLHRYLENALLVSVDHHKKRPVDSRSRALWEQLFYVVLRRDGSYLVGPCGQENGALVMHPDAEHLKLREEFRNRRDAEVVGQVCAVLRKL